MHSEFALLRYYSPGDPEVCMIVKASCVQVGALELYYVHELDLDTIASIRKHWTLHDVN